MTRTTTGPSFRKLMVLMAVLIGSVLVYRTMSSMQLDLVSKQSHNRVVYEQLYSEANNEVAYWRQRFDHEFARAESSEKALREAENDPKQLRQEIEDLKSEIARLKKKLKKAASEAI